MEIREYNVENNKVIHVWFNVETLMEAEKLILKRVFSSTPIESKWCMGNKVKWDSGDGLPLTLFKVNDTEYDLDYTVGPETIRRYIIEN